MVMGGAGGEEGGSKPSREPNAGPPMSSYHSLPYITFYIHACHVTSPYLS